MKLNSVKPSKRFNQVTTNANKLTTLIGLNFLTPKFSYTINTWITIDLLTVFFCFTIWTMFNQGRNNWNDGLKHSVMLGSGFQALAKLITGLTRADSIRSSIYFCRNIYTAYEDKGDRYWCKLHKSVDRIEYVIKVIRVGYLISFVLMIMLPFSFYALEGSRFLIMQYHIPFFDVNTDMGYFFTNGVHSLSMVIGGFGLYAGDLFVLIFLSQSLLFADILRLKVEDLNELLKYDGNIEMKIRHLVDISKWHQLYIEYSNSVNDLFYHIVSVQVLSSAFSITVTLFIMLTTFRHLFFYFYLILTSYNMVVYCILGTRIEYTNDDIYYEMCNILWYRMNSSQRKMLILILMQSQKPTYINIMSVMPLSMSTALKITKCIYSMAMMFTQFVEN